MSVYVQDSDLTIHVGDVREVLPTLPSESVDLVATSPPFYALRDYGVDGQIGLEESPEAWADELVGVFRECRRVLRPSGSMFVECGDSYVSGQGGRQSSVGELPPTTRFDRKDAGEARPGLPSSFGERDVGPRFYPSRDTNLKPKDLLGQPFLLAFALRADGWYWRGCYPWAKPNAMPESAKDRCTTAHSYVLHFAKGPRYFFDGDAISEPAAWERWGDQTVPKYEGTATSTGWMQPRTKAELQGNRNGDSTYIHQPPVLVNHGNRSTNGKKGRSEERRGFDNRLERADGRKHPRSVWTIPTQGYAEAHFATWPEKLAERIILAGCPEGGTVLDPFLGSGTTALVARKHGRNAVGIELNPEYAQLAAKRCQQLSLLAG